MEMIVHAQFVRRSGLNRSLSSWEGSSICFDANFGKGRKGIWISGNLNEDDIREIYFQSVETLPTTACAIDDGEIPRNRGGFISS